LWPSFWLGWWYWEVNSSGGCNLMPMSMSSDTVFFGAAILTAFTDNTAETYLGLLVEGLSVGFKYAFVAGAVTGSSLR
jgi:hypothetical protein